MISLSDFRANIFQNFKLMRDTGAVFKVYHRRKVYNVSVTPAEQSDNESLKLAKPYKITKPFDKSDVVVRTCEVCGDTLVNNICMNKQCPNAVILK